MLSLHKTQAARPTIRARRFFFLLPDAPWLLPKQMPEGKCPKSVCPCFLGIHFLHCGMAYFRNRHNFANTYYKKTYDTKDNNPNTMRRLRHLIIATLAVVASLASALPAHAQERRPIDSRHPMWLVHIDVWHKADPQKIIDLIPEDIRPWICMNLSLSCQYDPDKNVYKMPQNAVKTYKSWASVCQANGMWFTCQPASGGHTHIQDDDLETFEYFFKHYPNFLGWNYAEQFWGFDEPGDMSSSTQSSRIALFAKLVPMAHKYGGLLTVSFCGNIWSHPLNPDGMMKRNKDLLDACRKYPEAILWLYKYTTSSCFYNNESVTIAPFIAGLAKNYGIRYDNCGWNGALDALLGKNHGKKYPIAAGIGTTLEQTGMNGGAVWDGPELTTTEDFQVLNNTTVNGYTRRNWGRFPSLDNAWIDMFRKVIDGTLYIPTREEVVGKTKVVVVNDVTSGSDEDKYAAWGDLYDGLYKQDDPFNHGNGQWMENYCYFKKTGRYGAIPVVNELHDDLAKAIPVKVYKASRTAKWPTLAAKVADFDRQYPEVSKGDLFVERFKNQLVTYTPYTYLNKKTSATADIPLLYNTCDSLSLTYGKLSSGIVKEHADHIDFYLNNYRTDTTTAQTDQITIKGASEKPTYTLAKRAAGRAAATETWDEAAKAYTLQVKHIGPVDVTIRCAGTATDRSTDCVDDTPLTADMPKQPEPYDGPVTIEAEDMDYRNIKSCVTDPYYVYPDMRGYAGNGFMDMGTNTSAVLRHEMTIRKAGGYNVTIRYTSPKKGYLKVSLNGTQTVNYEQTEQNEWKTATFAATLKEGKNTLVITNTSGVAMYIDNVTYAPAEAQPETYGVTIRPTEHGTVTADKQLAAEGEEVTLTITPDEGYALQAIRVTSSVFFTQQKYISVEEGATTATFTMPDDNVTLQPTFTDRTLAYSMDMGNVQAGTLPPGWKTTQENSEVHEYPNLYSGGARTMTGFGGYQGKALYWRNGKAEYGLQEDYPLTLAAGNYKLSYACAAWKGSPKFAVSIIDDSGKSIAASATHSATPNANGSTTANITGAKLYELPFVVKTAGDYIIQFMDRTPEGGYHEFLLLECRVNDTDVSSGIAETRQATVAPGIYSVTGMKMESLAPGINIIVMPNGEKRKVMVRR